MKVCLDDRNKVDLKGNIWGRYRTCVIVAGNSSSSVTPNLLSVWLKPRPVCVCVQYSNKNLESRDRMGLSFFFLIYLKPLQRSDFCM